MMLPSTIPIFPLPNVVLFPSVFLPLHIFEPRYRKMLADALSGDRIVGMVLLKGARDPGEEPPPVYDIGCAGLISHAERLPDGRSNIILRGIERFRIVLEVGGRSYRRAQVAALPETDSDRIRDELHRSRARLDPLLAGQFENAGWRRMVPADMGDGDLVNTLAQYLDLEPVEKQALLEQNDIAGRSRGLIDLMEMRAFATGPGRLGLQ
jgi:Lon protease-like protein